MAGDILCAYAGRGWLASSDLRWTRRALDTDFFARCLLMPRVWYVRDYAQYGLTLRERYRVPEVQAIRRSHELKLATPLEVLIVESSDGMQAGLTHILEETLAAQVVSPARTHEQTWQLLLEQQPDVALVNLEIFAGNEATLHAIVKEGGKTRLITLVDGHDTLTLQRAVAAGAWGCISREASRETILEAVRTVAAGGRYFALKGTGDPVLGDRWPVERDIWRMTGEELIQVGELTIHVESREVTRQGRPIRLSRLEFDLLAYLARHRGRVMTYYELLDHLWDCSPDGHTPKLVRMAISRLQRKICTDPNAPRYILNVRGVGYRLL
jgi:two-component system KDP operon response regulator KdpE